MVISADTSFLFSLYGDDCHSVTAADWIRRCSVSILITPFNDFELRNSLRFAESRDYINPGDAAKFLKAFDNAMTQGRIELSHRDLPKIIQEANRLSKDHTLTGGHRSFDIIHVAAAKLNKATHFLTFDKNQKKLAEIEGLIVPF